MFSRLRNRKAGGRKDRPVSRDGADARFSTAKNHTPATIDEDGEEPQRPATSGSRSGIVASVAPSLPPIPRVASQTSSMKSPISPSMPDLPSIRTVEEQAIQYSESTSPQELTSAHSGIGDVEPATGHELELVSSIDRAKAELLADKDQMDAMQMPPPSAKVARPRISISRPQLRSWTDFHGRPVSKASEKSSSQSSSNSHQVPTPYRLEEPKDYITPSLDVDTHLQASQRPRSRLTRLNPLSYLSRKRNSQIEIEGVDNSALQKRASYTPFKDVSDAFDPRIIGARVHDFSAPMPSQYVSVQDLRSLAMDHPPTIYLDPRRGSDSNLPPKKGSTDPSPERRHVPIFKEDFSDSAEGWRLDPEDRRNQVTTNIVDKVAALEQTEKSEKRKSSLPAFAQHMPQDLPSNAGNDMMATPAHQKLSPRPPTESDLAWTPNSIQQTPDSLKPPKDPHRNEISPGASPLADKSYAPSPETPHTLSSLPRHLRSKTASVKSQASRFSFDMIGSGSAAQEKMLEERHRQRAAQRARAASITGASINEEDDFDEDDYDFDDDGGEDFPGMGDSDEYSFTNSGVANMTLDGPVFSPVQELYEEEEEDIPETGDDDFEDDGEEGAGAGGLSNMTLESFKPQTTEAPLRTSRHMPTSSDGSIQGLGLRTDLASTSKDAPVSSPIHALQQEEAAPETSPLRSLKDRVQIDINDLRNDGFYFDDGEFDGEFDNDDVLDDGEAFDEELLDADFERGKPLVAPLNSEPAEPKATQDSSEPSSRPTSLDSDALVNRQSGVTADTSRTSLHARRSSAYGQHAEEEGQAGLTQENLAAYHNALAFAANQAALQGRFDRKPGNTSADSTTPDEQELQRRLMPPPSDFPLRHGIEEDYGDDLDDDDFDFDDSMDDDAIIAAANAEALENDDDGFYGQEFGFYAHVGGTTESQQYHGGFFGPAGMGKVKRSHSGRHDFQEPSLTPITERSEWSNRNSMISLAMQSGPLSPNSALAVPAQGLAQLADQMQHDGSIDDMSLSALMRARRSAFGGSSTSLHSMGGGTSGSRSASPNQYSGLGGAGYAYPPQVPQDFQNGMHPPRSGSALSQASMTNAMPALQTHNIALRPTTGGSDSSPLKRSSATRERPGHSRNSSSAESVSYALERDEDGGNQWFLERRRTLDNGETEVMGREIVQGTL